MSERDIAIKINNVKKRYRLGQIGGGTLQGDLQSWWARIRGKEDPNTKIGTDQRLIGQTFMALNGIDLTVYKGEALGIIGRNGAGKSTLLKLLSRVTAPTEGTIDIYGRITSMLEVGTGFHPEMTGRENVYLNGTILGMTKAEIDSKMDQIIEFSEVGDFIDTPVKRYSSGMYVKLAFSVAAHLDSEIMIMDEVLAVGDMAFQKKCIDKMSESSRTEGKTILYVSHNMNTIRQLCDRCIVLDQGKIIFDGDVEEAISIYSHNDAFENVKRTYNKEDHQAYLQNDDLRLVEAYYEEKNECTFDRDEPVKIHYIWKTKKNLKGIGIRLEIRNDDETPLGIAVSSEICDCKEGEITEAVISYTLSDLAPGRYKTLFTFFQNDKFGNGQDLDCVSGMDINIREEENSDLVWRSKYWGHIRFSNPVVLNVGTATYSVNH